MDHQSAVAALRHGEYAAVGPLVIMDQPELVLVRRVKRWQVVHDQRAQVAIPADHEHPGRSWSAPRACQGDHTEAGRGSRFEALDALRLPDDAHSQQEDQQEAECSQDGRNSLQPVP